MELVTVFTPLTTTGPGKTLVQTDCGARLVVDSKKNVPLVGHVNTTFGPDGVMVNCGGATASERLNTVPDSPDPPDSVVPKSVLPDTANSPIGNAPSRPLKLWRVIKAPPSIV